MDIFKDKFEYSNSKGGCQNNGKRKRRGRKDKWEKIEMIDKLSLVEHWARQGYTEISMCETLDVSYAVWSQWKMISLNKIQHSNPDGR